MEKITVFDVAGYVLDKTGAMPTMKLQKLVYYCQAWSLVWDEKPLFDEPIEAWASGSVVRVLYDFHRGQFDISAIPATLYDVSKFSEEQLETMDSVINFYKNKDSYFLSELVRYEAPWQSARAGLEPCERGHNVIAHKDMAEYYGSL